MPNKYITLYLYTEKVESHVILIIILKFAYLLKFAQRTHCGEDSDNTRRQRVTIN